MLQILQNKCRQHPSRHAVCLDVYKRQAVYKDFGFTDFIDKFDFPKNVKRVREYISDEANVDRIISEYEKNRKKTDQPFYMYNMTIQNHSPYDKDAANFKQPIKIESSKYDAEANRYLNLIKYSDDSLKQLTSYFEKCKEDVYKRQSLMLRLICRYYHWKNCFGMYLL